MNYLKIFSLLKNPDIQKVGLVVIALLSLIYLVNGYIDMLRARDRQEFDKKLVEVRKDIATKELVIDDLKTEIISLNLDISENNKKIRFLESRRSNLQKVSKTINKETITDEELFNRAKEILSKFDIDVSKFTVVAECTSRK